MKLIQNGLKTYVNDCVLKFYGAIALILQGLIDNETTIK